MAGETVGPQTATRTAYRQQISAADRPAGGRFPGQIVASLVI
ncbi:MAG TPA: hypothetical protein VG056_03945 [Pirellulales bacterium]|nr:hypothetical protein [Pirellulales bacterium]